MTLKERLLKRLPKKYHERVLNLEPEEGLIDGCKYILTFSEHWLYHGDYASVPVKSIKEAVYFTKQTQKVSI